VTEVAADPRTGVPTMPFPVRPRDRRHLSWAAAGAIVLLLAVAALAGGADAVLGAAMGLVLVAAFFLGGRLPIWLGGRVPAGVAFVALGTNYALRIVLLLLVLRALRGAQWVDSRMVGIAVVLGALVWSLLQVVGHVTSRRPTIEPMGSRR
jgi:hypothetical protein